MAKQVNQGPATETQNAATKRMAALGYRPENSSTEEAIANASAEHAKKRGKQVQVVRVLIGDNKILHPDLFVLFTK